MSRFFNKPKTLSTLKSLLIKKLHSISSKNNFLIYKNKTIFHKDKSFVVPLLIIDENRGIYIFEKKDWSFDELKNAKPQKFNKQLIHRLTFEKIQNLITAKLEKQFKDKNIPIFKFLLMENLNIGQYDYLDKLFHDLLFKNIIMFNDMTEKEILEKLETLSSILNHKIEINSIATTIFSHYSMRDKSGEIYLCSDEQIEFIDEKIIGHSTLNAPIGSGRTTLLLLKSIVEVLKDRESKVVIIKPTKVACERLEQNLFNILERNDYTIVPHSIEILTPIEVVNRHRLKLHKKELSKKLEIDNLLMSKKFHLANQIFCDDVDFIEKEFIYYLIHIQKNSPLLFVTNNIYETVYSFKKSFRLDNQKMNFSICEPHKKMIEIVKTLLNSCDAKDILIVTNNVISVEIIKHQIGSSINHNTGSIEISTYNNIYGLNGKFIILMNSCIAPYRALAYSFYLAEKEVFILYEKECEQINSLRNSYESNKN